MYNYIWYFILFAFAGYIGEVCFAAAHEKKFVNRGFLTGPVCPIYGIGVTIVYFTLYPIRSTWLTLFVCSIILTSALEWLTGFVLEKIFHHKWWDYSDIPFHIGSYVCLSFSLVWGAACVIVVRFLIPLVDTLIALIPHRAGMVIQWSLLCIIAADVINTVIAMVGLNRRIMTLAELSERIKTAGSKLSGKLTENADALKEAYDNKLSEFGIRQRRILSAFPNLKSIDYHEQLTAVKGELERLKGKTAERTEQLKQRVVHAPVSEFFKRIFYAVPLLIRVSLGAVVVAAIVVELIFS